MVDGNIHLAGTAHGKASGECLAAVDADGHRRRCGPFFRVVLYPQPERDRFADDAERRRLYDHQAAVALALGAGQQYMQRCAIDAGFIGILFDGFLADLGHIVDLTVGEQHGAGEASLGDIGDRPFQFAEQFGAVLGLLAAHYLEAQILEIAEGGAQFLQGPGQLAAPLAGILAGGFIDHDHRHIGLAAAVLGLQMGIEEGQCQYAKGEQAQEAAARAAQHAERQKQDADGGGGGHQAPIDERRKADAGEADHCPSLSRIAGRCT